MPDDYSRQIDFDNDVLLRRLDPQLWDVNQNEAFPDAFEDPGKNYKELSFYVERCVASPIELLKLSAHYSAVMKSCGTSPDPPTVEQMLLAGYGVARVPASVIKELNLNVKPTSGGDEIDELGHVNVVDGRRYGIALADTASGIPHEVLRTMITE
jgi:hypothetical protein